MYKRLAATLSALPLRELELDLVGYPAVPSDFSALGNLTGVHRLLLLGQSLQPLLVCDSTLLPALRELTSLRELCLADSSRSRMIAREPDLATLERMPHLQRLALGLHPDADLNSLTCLRQLTSLELCRASAAQQRQLSVLTGLRVLQGLQIGWNRDLSYLASMAALTELSLSCYGVGDHGVNLAGLGSLQKLERLHWYGETDDLDLEPLSGLTALCSLTFLRTSISEVHFLRSLRQLTELHMEVVRGVLDPMQLSHLTALDSLHLNCLSITLSGWLSQLTNLRALCLRTHTLHGLAALSRLWQLKDLSLTDHHVTSLHDLADLNLQTLSLCECWQLRSLSPLRRMTRLRVLTLSCCILSAASGLSALTTLTNLSLHMTHMSEPETLSSLTNLCVLDVWDSPVHAIAQTFRAILPWVKVIDR